MPGYLAAVSTPVDARAAGDARRGLVGVALAGLHWAPETCMRVMMACLPVMALHTLSVSMVSYQLIRQSARHNQMLDDLRRMDALTGLFGRGHWQEQAEAALRRHHNSNESACRLMLGIDYFKGINDEYGHTVGDEVVARAGPRGAQTIRGHHPSSWLNAFRHGVAKQL